MIEPNFNENALTVLKERYLWKDKDGTVIETPAEMLERVAGTVAMAEKPEHRVEWAKAFYDVMARLDFLPNSPTLMNAGRKGVHGQLSACYVLGIEDSMESIFEALKRQSLIHKSGGGTGFNFSNLRAAGDVVNSTNGKASGPVSFMGMFNHATDVVQQGGMRRGANMGILNVEHHDIRKFIKAKVEEGQFSNFNISVGASDSFMLKVLDGDIEANDLFNEIVYNAWKSGDPGMIFLDTINAKNTTPWLGRLEATNPCVTGDTLILTSGGYRRIDECVGEAVEIWNGEEFSEVVPQVTGENQEVMTVSLSNGVDVECTPYHKFVVYTDVHADDAYGAKIQAKDLLIGDNVRCYHDAHPTAFKYHRITDIKRTGKIADKVYCFTEEKNHTGIFNGVLLGQCGETPLYPNEACNLGSINLAHMVKDGQVYWEKLGETVHIAVRFLDNVIDINHFPLKEIEEAVKRTRKIGLGVMGWAEMLFQLGIAYDSDKALSLACDVMKHIQTEGRMETYRLALQRGAYDEEHSIYRNATITCIAPTGTISLLAGCSSGIEPVFALKHKRIAFASDGEKGKELEYYNPYYLAACEDGSLSDAAIERIFVTSHQIAPEWHVKMQACFQKYTDLAVSKTVNLPHDATVEDVRDVYLKAWRYGCKGVTVYRDGCKSVQVLYAEPREAEEKCPQCGAAVVHTEGCVKCSACSWGKCSI